MRECIKRLRTVRLRRNVLWRLKVRHDGGFEGPRVLNIGARKGKLEFHCS